jgi:hypothetical protein
MSEGNVAVDVGFGQTKWAVKLDGVIITGGFPSLAPISSGVTVSTNESMGGKRNTVKVVVGNTSFEIGPDSHLAKSEASTGRSLSEEFPTTNNYKALLLGACIIQVRRMCHISRWVFLYTPCRFMRMF